MLTSLSVNKVDNYGLLSRDKISLHDDMECASIFLRLPSQSGSQVQIDVDDGGKFFR